MPKYETYAKVKNVYGVSSETVKNWARRGQIRYKCVQNETRKTWLYDMESIGELLQRNTEQVEREAEAQRKRLTRVIYIRVSSNKQSADLERQRQLLSLAFPDTEIIEDIGSGINFKRPGLSSLVRRICRDEISQIVVTFKDRIARIGYELFKQFCTEHGCNILVYGEDPSNPPDDESDLKDDLLSIITVFVARHNGKRAGKLSKERKRLEAERGLESAVISNEVTN
jgi:predicted site-specific integrase-resolvase